MSVIIRLQNLPWSANATDIRQFFKGLGIPDGGVHIVGGENGDAFIAFATDDDARKAMRLDGSKLKEIQVRLFLSSRAEMQEVIESARQTTISLMQMQQPAIARPIVATVPPPVLTPQSPPQASLATAIQQKMPPTLPTQLPGLITQQMYQQQMQQLQQQNPVGALNGLPTKTSDTLDLVSSRRSRRSRSRSRSHSYSRSRSRSRSPSRSHDRYRRRSRSPRRNKGRSHRDRSDSRDRDRRRNNRPNARNDMGRNGNDKRSSVEMEPNPSIVPNQMNAMNSLYQQNVPFNSNISQYMMKQMNNPNAGIVNPLAGQSEQISAFSTNDVRTMNMNMSLQTNPLAFQQHLYGQQQPVNMPAFNTFSQTAGVLQNAQQQQHPHQHPHHQQMTGPGMSGQLNKFGMNNGMGGGGPYCVRVRNLCNLTNYSAIRKFFAGLLIPNDGIKMINDTDGNRTGQAYVRFARPNFVQLAIQRSNQKLGRNIIKIEELDEKTYEEALDAYRPPRRNNYRDHDRDRDRRYRRNSRDSRDYSDDDDDDDRNSSKGNSDNDRDNDVMCISDSNDSKESAPFTTVLIEDLPPFTKEQDIMKLFSSYPLVHIVMAKRPKMFSSYVKFHSADHAKAAVKNTACHKISFKTVYISACSEEEFQTARKEFSGELDLDIGMPKANVEDNSSSSNDKNDRNEIKSPDTSIQNDEYMNDESNEVSDHSIAGVSLENIPGVNLNDPRINPAKFPFLKNMSQMDTKHSNERIDPRTKSSVQAPISNAFNVFGMDGSMAAQQQSMMDMNISMTEVCCVLIENMEYRTTEMEIVEWSQVKANLTPIRIQLLVNERNQTNGSGFIQFANSEQATKAMELLDKAQFKSRVVHVSLASWQQIMMTIQNITQILRENGFDGIDTSGNIPRPPRYNNNNNNPNNRFQNNNRFNNNGHNNRMPNNRPNRNGANMNGCVVSMSNVPYKASVEDILDFFSDFDLSAEDVIRRYNDEGKPTGDARVRFDSPSEARRAIDLRDKCRLTNRPVYLQLFNQH
ncbi:probable cyclin-dependent serine/threonine-protein kinase DDB_G0292550 [Contarinia nasturtii]|uniref:probable cyclin-dependent serine/threonine-protein kinase DDB_G0292550 n=1 Tax=Contarinia nasturtii TaxID=265458 RepID=UPI0012D48762|nr:probable cyclin-dependent serine/threonine-protein kinase DDB_G0292550 [Contarinia nasturtii]XP_031625567.1 probable cyclin-dependent serine/threonine-protein kinase DDB_G0292550 [Contarinia nasturtii]